MNTTSRDITIADETNTDEVELLEKIKKNIESYYDLFADNIEDGKECKEFSFGNQWDDDVLLEYKTVGKVALTFNKLNTYTRRLVGEVRAFTPALKVKRTDDEDEDELNSEMAQIMEDRIRSVSLESDAKNAYRSAFRDEIIFGFGVLSVGLEFVDEDSFEQKPTIEAEDFPERAFFDPSAKKSTKWDGNFCGAYDVLSKEEFKNIYGFEPDYDGTANAVIEESFAWIDQDNVSVVDYYQKEFFKKTIIKIKNGATIGLKKYNELVDILEKNRDNVNPAVFDEMEIVQKRVVNDFKIMNYKVMGNKILEKKLWPIKLLPKIFVDGDSYKLNGKQITQAFIKDAMDPQKLLNFVNSEIAQNIKDVTKEDYIGTPANIKGLEKKWKDKRRRKGILLANPDPKTGGLPIKQPPSQINPQLHPLSLKIESDIRSSLGVFESNQGDGRSNVSDDLEVTRITQGNLSTFVFVSNLISAIEQVGRVVLELDRAILKGTRKISGIDEQGEETTNTINEPMPFGGVQNDITKGKFKIFVSAASAFTIQKLQEYRDILSYVSAFPAMQQIIPDIAARKLNTDESMEISSRAKATLPLSVKATDKKDPQAAKQAQQQLQQQQQQQQMLKQMQIMLAKQDAQDRKIKALADDKTATANLENAQTNRAKAQQGGILEVAKLQQEEKRTEEATQVEALKMLREEVNIKG